MNANELKEIALAHFAEKGYDGTSLSSIAADAGIKKPSIYAHFPSKLDLFRAIVRDFKKDYLDCWESALQHCVAQPPDRQLETCFHTLSRHYMQDRIKMAFWVRLWMFPPPEIAQEIRNELQSINKHFVARIEEIFRQGIRANLFLDRSPHELAHSFFCLLDGYLMRAICLVEFDYAHCGQQIWQSFLTGVRIRQQYTKEGFAE